MKKKNQRKGTGLSLNVKLWILEKKWFFERKSWIIANFVLEN